MPQDGLQASSHVQVQVDAIHLSSYAAEEDQ